MRVGAEGETCVPSKETTCVCQRPRMGDTLAHLRRIRGVYKPDEEAAPLIMGKLLKHPHSYSISLAQLGPVLQGACALEDLLSTFLSPPLVFGTSWIWQCHLGGCAEPRPSPTWTLLLSSECSESSTPWVRTTRCPKTHTMGLSWGSRARPWFQNGSLASRFLCWQIQYFLWGSHEIELPEWCWKADLFGVLV